MRNFAKLSLICIICLLSLAQVTQAQRGGPRPGGPPPPGGDGGPMLRYHEVVQSDGTVALVPATVASSLPSQVQIRIEGDWRIIESNGIPEHNTGAFPNEGNPNAISAQSYRYTVPAGPELSGQFTPTTGLFGVCINGVPLDPGAAEFFHGDRASGWQYEALSGAIALGLDESHAHVQPTGAYHYHAAPSLLLNEVGFQHDKHSPLIGWACDGFSIYALYGWDEGGSVHLMRSSYRIKSGYRPAGENQLSGTYDGTFVNEYEHVAGTSNPDSYNGSQSRYT